MTDGGLGGAAGSFRAAQDVGFDRSTGEFTGLGRDSGGAAELEAEVARQLAVEASIAPIRGGRAAPGSFRAAQDVGTTLTDFQGLLTPDLQGQENIAAGDLPDILRDTILAQLSQTDRSALGVANALTNRFLGFSQQPAVEGGQLGFQGVGNVAPLFGQIAAPGFGPLFGPLAKRLAGLTPDFRLGFRNLAEIEALNAARRNIAPGDVEGGERQFLSFDDPGALGGGAGLGGGGPAISPDIGQPGTQGVGFERPEDLGLGVPTGGLSSTEIALAGFQRDRLVEALADRIGL